MKQDFYIIWTPSEILNIGIKSHVITNYEVLKEAIGLKNANKTFTAAFSMTEDTKTLKFRKCGKIEIRLK